MLVGSFLASLALVSELASAMGKAACKAACKKACKKACTILWPTLSAKTNTNFSSSPLLFFRANSAFAAVKLRWIKEPPKEMIVSLNQELKLDCVAEGEPKATMRWERLLSSDFGSQFGAGKHKAAPSNNQAEIMASTSANKNQLASAMSAGSSLAASSNRK